MADKSSIQWTEATWNPITGCTKVSQGCKNCYAERIWPRVYGKFRPFSDVQLHEDRLTLPLSWKKPRMVFVNSMSDLFHESLTDQQIDRVFAVMALCGHRFQILSKRAKRMSEYMKSRSKSASFWQKAVPEGWTLDDFEGIKMVPFPLPNVWLGVSVENQETADERIPLLLQTPAAVRWISAEPLLGPINLKEHQPFSWTPIPQCVQREIRNIYPGGLPANSMNAEIARMKLDWVVVGGESGHLSKVRPFDLRWAYDLVAQCKAAGVPVFVKQLGRKPTFSGGDGQAALVNLAGIQDSHGGLMSEWPEDLRIREFPRAGE